MCSLDDATTTTTTWYTDFHTVSTAKSRAHHDTTLEATGRRVRFLVILWALGDLGSRLGAGFEFAFRVGHCLPLHSPL